MMPGIERVEMYHVRMRMVSPFETSFGVEHDREAIVLRLQADGLEGWGECVAGGFPGYSYETVGTAWHVLEQFFIPAVLQRPSLTIAGYRSALDGYKGHPLARAGLELALWDLLGRSKGSSLSEMLGGVRSRVAVGVSIGIQPDAATLLGVVEGYLTEGYRRIKLKIKPGRDEESEPCQRYLECGSSGRCQPAYAEQSSAIESPTLRAARSSSRPMMTFCHACCRRG
jgi:O-succinylbenzoate synthase